MQKSHYLIIASILFSVLFVYLLSPILTPFFVGILLAYLTEPLVKRLMKFKLSRRLSVGLVFLLIFIILCALILLLIPLLQAQIDKLTDLIPKTVEWLQQTIIPWLKTTFGVSETLVNVTTLKQVLSGNIEKAGGAADWMFKTVLHSSATLIEWVVNLILIPVVAFYLLCDWTKFVKGIKDLFPRNVVPTVTKLMNEFDSVLSAFFRGQLTIMLVVSVLYSIGLTAVGLQVGLLIGVFAGMIGIVPYLGFIIGITLGTIAALVQFDSFSSVALVWMVFIIVHFIENFFLFPKLMGNSIGLHPVAVIFAILAGGCLFGFLGVLLALPVAAVIMVCIRHLHASYRQSELYQSAD